MNKLKISFTFVIIIALLTYWVWIFISREVSVYRLKNNSKIIKAVIIDKRNYMGNSPVSHEYSYSYEFKVDGKVYTADAIDPKFKPFDTILVKYAQDNPELNEPVDATPER